jgi:hypothetical protein
VVTRPRVEAVAFWRAAGVFAAAFVALNVWVAWSRQDLGEERRRNLLLESAESLHGGRAEPRAGETFGSYWERIPDARSRRLVFVSGMSQMYAVNDRQQGDRIIADRVDEWLEGRGASAVSLAGPNLDNEEALFFLLAGLSDPRRHPSVFVYGVCFDKFRNVDLRREFQEFAARRPVLRHIWLDEANLAEGLPLATEKMRSTAKAIDDASHAAAGRRPEEKGLEPRLRDFIARYVPVVAAREELNGRLQMDLFLLRNWLLQIEPSTKRPVIPARYQLNQEFLQLLIRVAKREGVVPVLYVIPLNPRAENPYIPAEYARFKEWVSGLAVREAIPFANLEGIVPSEHWGEFMGGPDFKHFCGEGHRITAAALIERFGEVMAGKTGAGS